MIHAGYAIKFLSGVQPVTLRLSSTIVRTIVLTALSIIDKVSVKKKKVFRDVKEMLQ